MEPVNLTDDQRLYLQAIFDYFHEHGKWPTYSFLERVFLQSHSTLTIDEIVKSLPPGLSKPFSAYMFDLTSSVNEEVLVQKFLSSEKRSILYSLRIGV
jgi:hypothetical protein